MACLIFLYRTGRDRPAVRSPLWAGTALAAAVLCAVPFLAHGKALHDDFAAVAAEFGDPENRKLPDGAEMGRWEMDMENVADADDPVPIRYVMEADLSPGPVELEMELKAPAVPLTLRRVFRVESVVVDGRAVPVDALERSGDRLQVPLPDVKNPGEQVMVELTYSGRIEDWRMRDWPTVLAIARKQILLVPAPW